MISIFTAMGRRSINKFRVTDPEKQGAWLDILTPHLRQRGIRDLSADEMASLVGVSKATFYKYFRSRDEVVELFTQRKLDNLKVFIDILNDESLDYIARYRKSNEEFCRNLVDVSAVFLADVKDMYPEVWNNIVQFRTFSEDMVHNFYKKAIRAGIFTNINPVILRVSDHLAFERLSDPEFLKENNMELADALSQYFEIRFNGIVNNKI